MLRLRRVARAVAFRSSAASLCRELRRAFPSTNPISMLEQGERPNAALVGVGLVLGLAMALVVRHQVHVVGSVAIVYTWKPSPPPRAIVWSGRFFEYFPPRTPR